MLSLSEVQAQFRAAVVARDAAAPAMLTAPVPVGGRLEIYRRHYREALARHIVGRYPTVEWLLGSDRMRPLAEQYIRVSPPTAPCMAEYGAGFVEALKWDLTTSAVPYVHEVAELDWHLGGVSVATSGPALAISALADHPAERLPDLGLRLQPGTRYLESGWPIDELVRIRLGEQPPEQLEFKPYSVALEISGARGQFRITRLDRPVFKFRAALATGDALGDAVTAGVAVDPNFDFSLALATVFAEGLVIDIISPAED
jgi:hypothetical protein